MRKVYEGSDSTISENGVIGGSMAMEFEWEVGPVLNSDRDGLLQPVLLVLGLLLNLDDGSVAGGCGYGGKCKRGELRLIYTQPHGMLTHTLAD